MLTCTKLQNLTHLQQLDVLQLRPSIQQFPMPKLSTWGRQEPEENLWILSMVLMLGSLSRPSGSSKLDMVKWLGKRELAKDVHSKYSAAGIHLPFFLPFSPGCKEIYIFIYICIYSIHLHIVKSSNKSNTPLV